MAGGVMHVMCAGEADRFAADGIVTKDGTSIPADLVIYATGFDRPYEYMPVDVLAALGRTGEGIALYRDTLPTQVEVRCSGCTEHNGSRGCANLESPSLVQKKMHSITGMHERILQWRYHQWQGIKCEVVQSYTKQFAGCCTM